MTTKMIQDESSIAYRLRTAREAKGLSQGALASAAGLSLNAVNKYERGHNKPRVEAAERLAVALSIAPGWLLFGTD